MGADLFPHSRGPFFLEEGVQDLDNQIFSVSSAKVRKCVTRFLVSPLPKSEEMMGGELRQDHRIRGVLLEGFSADNQAAQLEKCINIVRSKGKSAITFTFLSHLLLVAFINF